MEELEDEHVNWYWDDIARMMNALIVFHGLYYVRDAMVGWSDGFSDQDKLPVLNVFWVDQCGVLFSWNGGDVERGFHFLKEVFELVFHMEELR